MTDTKHHSHEISDHPEVQWALDLLKPDPNYRQSVMKEYVAEAAMMTIGFICPCVANFYQYRPWYAGFQKHVAGLAVGYVVAQGIKSLTDWYQADRDTKLRDYIIRHPELFPEPERKKFSKVLEPWMPIR